MKKNDLSLVLAVVAFAHELAGPAGLLVVLAVVAGVLTGPTLFSFLQD